MKKITSRMALLFILFFTLTVPVRAVSHLIPVGKIVGLELEQDQVSIAAFDEEWGEAARQAGLRLGDVICSIDGIPIKTAEDIRKALDRSDGTIDLGILRKGEEISVKLSPEITPDGPKLGLFLRSSITGIGTVTWYDPASGKFGTLGHGVSNAEGALLEMAAGSAYDAKVISVRKGKTGAPGQLLGGLNADDPIGKLTGNTPQGVFGIAEKAWQGEAYPICGASQVHTGEATILSTVEGTTPREYSVEILKLYPNSDREGRNMLLRVTDPALLEATGGIVQGMSGSPIIQDGKLVGAVTHVLVNDPTTGYGIFIENMLDAAA